MVARDDRRPDRSTYVRTAAMARQQSVQALCVLAALLFAASLPSPAAAGVHLSSLPKALDVTTSAKPGQGARAFRPGS